MTWAKEWLRGKPPRTHNLVYEIGRSSLFIEKLALSRSMAPTPKNMALAHLDPMWPPSAQNPGGMWVRRAWRTSGVPPDILAPALNLDVNLAGFQQHVCTVLFRDFRSATRRVVTRSRVNVCECDQYFMPRRHTVCECV